MPDILFVVPQFSYKTLDEASTRCPPLGIAILASVLEEKGYDVEILDSFALGLDKKQITDYVVSENPTVIGISSVTANYPESIQLINSIKRVNPDIIIIYGGPHVTIMPETVIKFKSINYAVLGEAEETIVELLDFILKSKGQLGKIKGIAYRDNNGHVKINQARDFIKDINKLPMPAYHLLPMNHYRSYGWLDLGRKFCSMITSRGCPFQCTYCTSSNIFGYRWRYRSPEKVMEEIRLLYDKYKVRHIYFQDDEFTVNHDRVMKICDMIIDQKLDLVWECLTRVSHVDEPLLRKMSEAGCRSILFGIECGYQEGIDKINKKITLKQAVDAVNLSKNYGISPKVTFMMGFPWEGEKEIKKTIRFAKKLKADLTFFNTLNPYPHTPIYYQIKKEGLFDKDYTWEKYSPHGETPTIRTRYLTSRELAYWNGRAYLSIYLTLDYILRKLKTLTNLKEFKRTFKSGAWLLLTSLKRVLTKT
ncbi:radical SAM protein [Candidatus Woesearchaeota archaeon]|nr:radical SAM protein [Candidatus Woesearchaeota archaeon]